MPRVFEPEGVAAKKREWRNYFFPEMKYIRLPPKHGKKKKMAVSYDRNRLSRKRQLHTRKTTRCPDAHPSGLPSNTELQNTTAQAQNCRKTPIISSTPELLCMLFEKSPPRMHIKAEELPVTPKHPRYAKP